MKKDKLIQLRKTTIKEVTAEITNLKKSLQQKQLEAKAAKLKNAKEVANLRRDLAQLLTILQMKRFEEVRNVKIDQRKRGSDEESSKG